jgi:DNA topoisomerase-1
MERTTVTIASATRRWSLRATGQVMLFDGFLKVYEEGRDDAEDEDSRRLPPGDPGRRGPRPQGRCGRIGPS